MAWLHGLSGAIDRLAAIGAAPDDSEDERLAKATATLSAAFITALSFVWVITYWRLGLPISAAIPLGYQVVSVICLIAFARTKRFALLRSVQLGSMLILPVLLQWSLGGFVSSSGVILWSLIAPLGAVMFGASRPWLWVGAYALVVATSGALDATLAEQAPDVPAGVVTVFFVMNILGVSTTALVVLQYFHRQRDRARLELAEKHQLLELEQEKSERLLLNVLPEPIAQRLKDGAAVIADAVDDVTVLFVDVVGFTPLASRLNAQSVVELLNRVFSAFDQLVEECGLEKIKTIGDAYMVVGGIPIARPDHAEAVADLALAMLDLCSDVKVLGSQLSVRIGIDTGPVVAGVIGTKKFSYDLWGDTVNTAARMESHGVPGAIQVSARAHDRMRHRFQFERRGEIEVKGKGLMETFLLLGRAGEQPAEQRMAASPVGLVHRP